MERGQDKFHIEFNIYSKHKELENYELMERTRLSKNLRSILAVVFQDDPHVKFLDRLEASISSIDEKKQFRGEFPGEFGRDKRHSIYFFQNHSCCAEYFTLEETKYIVGKIEKYLDSYLGRKCVDSYICLRVHNK